MTRLRNGRGKRLGRRGERASQHTKPQGEPWTPWPVVTWGWGWGIVPIYHQVLVIQGKGTSSECPAVGCSSNGTQRSHHRWSGGILLTGSAVGVVVGGRYESAPYGLSPWQGPGAPCSWVLRAEAGMWAGYLRALGFQIPSSSSGAMCVPTCAINV